MKNKIEILYTVATLFLATSCSSEIIEPNTSTSSENTVTNNGNSNNSSTTISPIAGSLATIPTGLDTNVVKAARRLTNALNAGNETEARNAFAENAEFDDIGRIYKGSADIMNRFLTPEVIRANGRFYEIRLIGFNDRPNVVRIEYDFRYSNSSVKFYYEYTITNNLISYAVGRYL